MTIPIHGKAVAIHASEIILQLEDGRIGVLSRREFTHLSTRDLRQLVKRDQEFLIVPLEQGSIESSTDPIGTAFTASTRVAVRLAARDEWEQAKHRFRPGSTVRGTVSGIESYGIFVDLLPGVTGMVPLTELPPEPANPPAFLAGDQVICTVQSINPAEKHIRLSVRAAVAEREFILSRGEVPPVPSSGATSADRVLPLQAWDILIVENDSQLRAELALYLESHGQRVELACSFQEASTKIRGALYDLLLLDIHLGDGSGLDLLAQLPSNLHPRRTVIMTDFASNLAHAAQLESLITDRVQVFDKQQLPEGLDQVLRVTPSASIHTGSRSKDEGHAPHATLDSKLARILRDLRRFTRATGLLLVTTDDTGQQLRIRQQFGLADLDEAELLAHWRFGPLRDALEDGNLVFSEDARIGKEAARFQYLQRAVNFASVIGASLPEEPRGALFIFHSEPGRFRKSHVQSVRAATERAAAALESERTQQALSDTQRFTLIGQFTAILVHEVNNELGNVRRLAEQLPGNLQALETQLRGGKAPDQLRPLWHSVHDASSRLNSASKHVVQLVNQMNTLSQQTGPQRWDAHEILENALAVTIRHARESGVELHQQFRHPAPYVRVNAAWLQQAVLNLILNAIQNFDPGRHQQAHVLIETRAASGGAARTLQIRICDNGPGIHTAYLDRVFQFGFSTRQGGSGIGLFITRRLIEQMEGVVRIEESYRLWGTTFLIELPTLPVIARRSA